MTQATEPSESALESAALDVARIQGDAAGATANMQSKKRKAVMVNDAQKMPKNLAKRLRANHDASSSGMGVEDGGPAAVAKVGRAISAATTEDGSDDASESSGADHLSTSRGGSCRRIPPMGLRTQMPSCREAGSFRGGHLASVQGHMQNNNLQVGDREAARGAAPRIVGVASIAKDETCSGRDDAASPGGFNADRETAIAWSTSGCFSAAQNIIISGSCRDMHGNFTPAASINDHQVAFQSHVSNADGSSGWEGRRRLFDVGVDPRAFEAKRNGCPSQKAGGKRATSAQGVAPSRANNENGDDAEEDKIDHPTLRLSRTDDGRSNPCGDRGGDYRQSHNDHSSAGHSQAYDAGEYSFGQNKKSRDVSAGENHDAEPTWQSCKRGAGGRVIQGYFPSRSLLARPMLAESSSKRERSTPTIRNTFSGGGAVRTDRSSSTLSPPGSGACDAPAAAAVVGAIDTRSERRSLDHERERGSNNAEGLGIGDTTGEEGPNDRGGCHDDQAMSPEFESGRRDAVLTAIGGCPSSAARRGRLAAVPTGPSVTKTEFDISDDPGGGGGSRIGDVQDDSRGESDSSARVDHVTDGKEGPARAQEQAMASSDLTFQRRDNKVNASITTEGVAISLLQQAGSDRDGDSSVGSREESCERQPSSVGETCNESLTTLARQAVKSCGREFSTGGGRASVVDIVEAVAADGAGRAAADRRSLEAIHRASLIDDGDVSKGESMVDTHISPSGEVMYPLKPGPPRRGKWSRLEEEYARRIINNFNAGLLDAEPGTGLRQLLASKLQCEVMRVSKKFCGWASVGKRSFRPVRNLNGEATRAQADLLALEQRWLKTVMLDNGMPRVSPENSISSSSPALSPTGSFACLVPAAPFLEREVSAISSLDSQTDSTLPALQRLPLSEGSSSRNTVGNVSSTLLHMEGRRYSCQAPSPVLPLPSPRAEGDARQQYPRKLENFREHLDRPSPAFHTIGRHADAAASSRRHGVTSGDRGELQRRAGSIVDGGSDHSWRRFPGVHDSDGLSRDNGQDGLPWRDFHNRPWQRSGDGGVESADRADITSEEYPSERYAHRLEPKEAYQRLLGPPQRAEGWPRTPRTEIRPGSSRYMGSFQEYKDDGHGAGTMSVEQGHTRANQGDRPDDSIPEPSYPIYSKQGRYDMERRSDAGEEPDGAGLLHSSPPVSSFHDKRRQDPSTWSHLPCTPSDRVGDNSQGGVSCVGSLYSSTGGARTMSAQRGGEVADYVAHGGPSPAGSARHRDYPPVGYQINHSVSYRLRDHGNDGAGDASERSIHQNGNSAGSLVNLSTARQTSEGTFRIQRHPALLPAHLHLDKNSGSSMFFPWEPHAFATAAVAQRGANATEHSREQSRGSDPPLPFAARSTETGFGRRTSSEIEKRQNDGEGNGPSQVHIRPAKTRRFSELSVPHVSGEGNRQRWIQA